MGFDNQDASKPPAATQNEGGLDATKQERKIGADPAIVGSDGGAQETASSLMRRDLHTFRIPESAADARNNLMSFRNELVQGEGVGMARTTYHTIEGQRVLGTESTSAEGVTTFHAPKGDRSWTVNSDGTYTPVPRNGDATVAPRAGDSTAQTLAGQFQGLPEGSTRYFNNPEMQRFLAAHPSIAQGERTVNGSTVTYTGADGARLSFDANNNGRTRAVSFNAGGDATASVVTGNNIRGEVQRVPVAATTPAPAAVSDTAAGTVRPGATVTPPVTDVTRPTFTRPGVPVAPAVAAELPKPGEVKPGQGEQLRPNPTLNPTDMPGWRDPNNPFNRAVTEAFGAHSYDPRTGQLKMPDGSVQQLNPNQLRQQYEQFHGQGDVSRMVDSLRQQQQAGQLQIHPLGHRGGEGLPPGQRMDVPGQRPDLQQILRPGQDGGRLDMAQLKELQAQRLQQFQQDMQNPQLRAQMLDAMRQIQAGNLQNLGPNGQRMADIMKDLGMDKSAALRQMLENPQGQMRFDKMDQLSQAKLANFMDLLQGKDSLRLPGTTDGGRPLTAVDRLVDFLRQHERVLDKVPTGESGRAFFMELNKILKDVNAQFGLEPGKGLTVSDIIGRRMQDGRLAAEMGLLPGLLDKSIVRPELRNLPPVETFGIKLNPGEQMAVRMMQLQQELAAKTLNPTMRLAEQALMPQIGSRPLDIVLQTARQLDSVGMKDAANLALNQVVREIGKDAGAAALAGLTAGREFNAAMKLDPAAMKAQDAQATAKAQQDAIAAAVQQLGMRVDPAIVKDAGMLSQQTALDATGMTPQNAAAMKALEEEQARRKKKQEEEEEDRLEKEQDMKDAALAAMLAAKKRKELKEKEEQEKADEKDKKEPERRVKYIVKEGDTLESIATKMLRDKRLAALIYEINKAIIPVVVRKGKEVVALRPKMVIWLPTSTDIKEFRGRLQTGGSVNVDFSEGSKKLTPEEELAAKYGENWEGGKGGGKGTNDAQAGEALEDLAADAVAAAKKRRENIEKLLGPLKSAPQEQGGRSKYVVRLGDTLKSVAMKHPLLQDVTLWKLLAEVNDITTKTDEKGQPMAVLRRGTSIAIPTAEEIDAYKTRDHKAEKKSLYSSGPHEIKTKNCGGCGRATIASASICPGCFRSFDEEVKAAPNTIPQPATRTGFSATRFGGAPTVPVASSGGSSTQNRFAQSPDTQPVSTDNRPQFVAAAAESDGPTTQIASEPPTDSVQVSESVRVSRCGEVETTGLKLRLEMRLTGTYWLPVVAYEIFVDVSLRHEYLADGSRKTVRIDLPPQAAKELAENDITSNWEVYCDKFASTAR